MLSLLFCSLLYQRGIYVVDVEDWVVGVSRTTEMTIRDLLREELRKRDVKVFGLLWYI